MTEEEAQLLAELRAISSKSSAASRFADDDGEQDTTEPLPTFVQQTENSKSSPRKTQNQNMSPPTRSPKVKKEGDIPPWKRPKPQTQPQDTLEMDATQENAAEKENHQITEDEPKLEPKQHVSINENETKEPQPMESQDTSNEIQNPKIETEKSTVIDPTKNDDSTTSKEESPSSVVKVESSTNSIKFKQPPKTFRGDRGGAAEDAELLELLKAVSSQSNNRFGDADTTPEDNKPSVRATTTSVKVDIPSKALAKTDTAKVVIKSNPLPEALPKTDTAKVAKSNPLPQPESSKALTSLSPSTTQTNLAAISNLPSTNPDEEVPTVTREELPDAIKSKDWKRRKAAFDLMTHILQGLVQQQKANDDTAIPTISDADILPALEEHVVAMVNDSNAGALDSALVFTLLYADVCKGARRSEQASGLASQILMGPAFSSPRPSTTKLVRDVLMKLMEVGVDGYASVHAVMNVVIGDGLSSKKPKVVTSAVSLIIDAIKAFGAASMPVANISSALPSLFGHANGTVREQALTILAEMCRALGSKTPLQSVIDSMKPTLVAQLDEMLNEQPQPTPPTVGLRSKKSSGGASKGETSLTDIRAALDMGEKELRAKKYAARPRVNILEEVKKTEYYEKIKETKWSEKVEALDILIKCGGERPFKLTEPSAAVNYSILIHEIKSLLSHTHFAVNCKAMAVLGMLAEGVGDKLYPHIRPLVTLLLGLSKDKKLSAAVGSCLDSFFGHGMTLDHLLEQEDAIPSSVNEGLEKNALVRKTALELLQRCIERNKDAGPRGSISVKAAEAASNLARSKLEDADPAVRKIASDLLQIMLDSDIDEVSTMTKNAVQELETTNPRVYKALRIKEVSPSNKQNASAAVGISRKTANISEQGRDEEEDRSHRAPSTSKLSVPKPSASLPKKEKASVASSSSSLKISKEAYANGFPSDAGETSEPGFDDALSNLSLFGISNWEASVEDGGVLAGLQSSMWQLRRDAIMNLIEFTKSDEFKASEDSFSVQALAVVKEYTKGFKEANFNVGKAIMELFIAVCDIYTESEKPLELWICKAATALAIDKIGDKKFSGISQNLLLSQCVVRNPNHVLNLCFKNLENVKSPASHEEFMIWSKSFCDNFGVAVLGNGLSDFVTLALKECESANVKVRASSLALIGEMYKQLGPALKALVLSNTISDSVKTHLESVFSSTSFDPKANSVPRSKRCVVLASKGVGDDKTSNQALGIEVPRTDLVATLSNDCISRLGSKDGKNAWKIRKEALEEVESGLQRCGGFVSTDPSALKSLLDLARGLRERLNDSQMNLKPVAAKIIANLLISVDEDSQLKLGRIFYSTLINAAINDNKKVMRDAALEALQAGTTKSEIDGGGVNTMSLEAFLQALTVELNDSEYKAGGLPDVLNFAVERAEHFPKAGAAKVQGFETQFSAAVVACLTSAKSETRSAAESLLRSCVDNGSLSVTAVDKGAKLLLPAQQRAIAHIINSLSRSTTMNGENNEAAKPNPIRPKSNSRAGRELRSSESVDSVPVRSSTKALPRSSDSNSESMRSRSTARSGRESNSSRYMDGSDAPRPLSRPQGRIPVGRESLAAGKRNLDSDVSSINELLDDPLFNPLKGPTPGVSSKSQRCSILSRQRENWPEYPEEPTGGPTFTALKKKWSQLIPSVSLEFFFPSGGLQKQEDAANGCYLLQRSIFLSKQDASDTLFLDQLDLVNKWLACALCSRDSPVGLGPIIDVIVDMISLMLSSNYQMNDVEAMVFLPYLVEKAGTAKERFRDSIFEILSSFIQNNIFPASKYGPFICVPVIEKTGNTKAKVVAIRELHRCVEVCGIDGIGKRGLTSTAKVLSDEHATEIKNALLDLIETVILKMDSDIQKYLKICTSSYLSGKARDLILERVSRTGIGRGPAENSQPSSFHDLPTSTKRSANDEKVDGMSGLKLNLGLRTSTQVSSLDTTTPDGPFTFSFQSKISPMANVEDKARLISASSNTPSSSRGSQIPDPTSFKVHQNSTTSVTDTSAAGAAASLRERLKQIRDKHRLGSQIAVASIDKVEGYVDSPPIKKDSPLISSIITVPPVIQRNPSLTEKTIFSSIIECVDKLLFEPIPLIPNNSRYFPTALDGLRRIHGSLTSTQSGALNQAADLEQLKSQIIVNMAICVERLASVLDFGFKCCHSDQTAGLSIPLLSVGIAALMAIFLDMDLAAHVTQTSLIHVLREASKGLLDPRLNATTPTDYPDLDDATCKKMAKAMNKLALQATSGTPRHAAFQALFSLQFQLCSNTVRDHISSRDVGNLNFRMSRIITKLFNRLVKEEEEEADPFSADRIDLEATFCSLEDMLIGCYNLQGNANQTEELDERMNPCISMARTLMLALVKARNSTDKVQEIETILTGLRLNSSFSRCGRLFSLCCNELDVHSHPRIITIGSVASPKSVSPMDTNTIASEGIKSVAVEDKVFSQLLFAVGSADGESETTLALNNLRTYVDSHSETDFEPYLTNLSRTFRSYILANRQNSTTNTMSSLRQRLAAAVTVDTTTTRPVVTSVPSYSSPSVQSSNPTTIIQDMSTAEAVSSAAALRARLESVKKKYMS